MISSYLAVENSAKYYIFNFYNKKSNKYKKSVKLNKKNTFSYHKLISIFISLSKFQKKELLSDISNSKQLVSPIYIDNNIIMDINSLFDMKLLKFLNKNRDKNILNKKIIINFELELVDYISNQLDIKIDQFLDI